MRFPGVEERSDVLGDVAEAAFRRLVEGEIPSLRTLATALVDAVDVCRGLSCQVAGATGLAAELRAMGRTVVEHECMFACAVAPVARVGGEIRGRVDSELAS